MIHNHTFIKSSEMGRMFIINLTPLNNVTVTQLTAKDKDIDWDKMENSGELKFISGSSAWYPEGIVKEEILFSMVGDCLQVRALEGTNILLPPELVGVIIDAVSKFRD